MLELIAVLLPFAVYVLIIVLVINIWRQVTPRKRQRAPLPTALMKDRIASLCAWAFCLSLFILAFALAIKFKSPHPLTGLSVAFYLLADPHGSTSERQKQQRNPVYSPKRNDWRVPREPKPSHPDTYKPVPLKRLKISDRRKQAPKRQKLSQYHPKQRELLNLLNGDRNTAQRLLDQCAKSNPGSSADWIFEKVIFDIVRDRR